MMAMIIALAFFVGLLVVALLSAARWRAELQQRNALIDNWIDEVREANGKIATRDQRITQLAETGHRVALERDAACRRLDNAEEARDRAIRAERQITEAYNKLDSELSWYKNLVHNRSEGAPKFGAALVGRRFAFVELPMTRESLAVLGARSRAARPPRRKPTTLRTITKAGQ
jgi:hypothetical protein